MKNIIFKTKKAFTLAEVLITLGIIGVVAAMTIPVLTAQYQKQATVERYKKVYSTLLNAIKRSEVDNGPISSWDDSFTAQDSVTNLPWLNTYILPYLSIAKSCNETTYSGCWADKYIKAPNGNNLTVHPNRDSNFMKYALADGTCIAFIFRDKIAIILYVDIDGPNNGTNTMGRDIFVFNLVNSAQLNTYAINVNHSGLHPRGAGRDIKVTGYSTYGCGKDVTDVNYAGSYCGQKIITDGYQIADDYPW